MIDIFEWCKNKFDSYGFHIEHYKDNYWFTILYNVATKWEDGRRDDKNLWIRIGRKQSSPYLQLDIDLYFDYLPFRKNTKRYKQDIPQNVLKSNAAMTRWVNKEISDFCGFKVKL